MEPKPGRNTFVESRYGQAWAERYDDIFPNVDETAIDFLEEMAGPERVALELAVGTGRVAIPLAKRGVAVTGVDISESMLARLVAKADSSLVTVVRGDMVEVPVDGEFPLVFIAFNSLFAVSSQARQVQLFANVSSHLVDGGRFVLECFVPDLKRFDDNHRHQSERMLEADGSVHIETSVHHPESKRVDTTITSHRADGTEVTLPVSIRYAWPSELDLMARLVGLEHEARFDCYDRGLFGSGSVRHVTVYRKPGER